MAKKQAKDLSPNEKNREALRHAKKLAATAESWLDLHNALFGLGGKCSELFKTRSERVAFAASPEHAQIMALLASIRDDRGDPSAVAELTARANGAISVRVPKTVHAALLAEAESEGVSLNQLCLAKLSTQLQALAGS